MQIIPLLPVPSQTLSIVLDGQPCQVNVYILSANSSEIANLPDFSSTTVTFDSTGYTFDIDNKLAISTSPQLYIDLSVAMTDAGGTTTYQPILTTRPLVTGIPVLLNSQYYGFLGDLTMVDTSGNDAQAVYSALGNQFQLVYLSPEDIALAVAA